MEGDRPIKAPKVEPQEESLPYETVYGSRPPTPTQNFVFNPVKTSPGYTASSTPSTIPSFPNTPAFPSLRTSWSDNVVPTTRHAHSLSAGSNNPTAVPFAKFSRSPTGSVVGRMNRSGSLGGSFTHPFQNSHAASTGTSPSQYTSPPQVWPNPPLAKPKNINTDDEEPDHDDEDDEDPEESTAPKVCVSDSSKHAVTLLASLLVIIDIDHTRYFPRISSRGGSYIFRVPQQDMLQLYVFLSLHLDICIIIISGRYRQQRRSHSSNSHGQKDAATR